MNALFYAHSGFRYIVFADDNFNPATLSRIARELGGSCPMIAVSDAREHGEVRVGHASPSSASPSTASA